MSNKAIERRVLKATELRSVPQDDGSIVLEGYSAVFNSPSEDMGWGDWEVREFIAPGAFTNCLKKSDARALFNHDPNCVLGRESAKTLTLTEDENGLHCRISLPDTQMARDLAVSVERGDIREQSFGFIVAKDQWEEDAKKKTCKRTILEIDELLDVSIVTYPAYPETDIAKRSYEQFRNRGNIAASDEKASLQIKILELMEGNK